ncbi:uncharacterized protein JCM6883_007144 [Sporobolomyces salmoneus]|uniref:uncharacterized protein n=1 Tax=Sporobolomyces salmoneus TaxID=183962 RepID=UPI003171B7F2
MDTSFDFKANATWTLSAEEVAKMRRLNTEGEGSVTLLVSPLEPREVIASFRLKKPKYDSSNVSWGNSKLIALDEFLDHYDKNGEIIVCCSVTWSDPASLRMIPCQVSLAHFDEHTLSNLLFRFPRHNNKPFVFASKSVLCLAAEYFKTLFSAGFSETSKVKSVDVSELRSIKERPFTFDDSELSPFYLTMTNLIYPNCRVLKVARILLHPRNERGLTTYRAMLAFLHCGEVLFTALPSDYLVARDRALAEHLPTDPSFAFDEPGTWLPAKFKSIEGQRKNTKIPPCSAHSMYRLADCYSIDGLKRLAKDRIVRCLTVENVAYELFSPLSIDYEEIQKPVLEFLVKNWVEVQKTTALKNVLDKLANGELAEGRELIGKMLTATSSRV